MARLVFFFFGGWIIEAVRSPLGLLAKGSALNDPAAQAAWQQQFETTLDVSLTRNLQALDQLLKHSTTLGQHFIDFQTAALAMSRQSKNLEHVVASSTNRLNAPSLNGALVKSQESLTKVQADMQATFQRMEQQYKTVVDRTKQTKALMDQVEQQRQAQHVEHQKVQQQHSDMLRNMQREQSDFDAQMRKLQSTMGEQNSIGPSPTAAPSLPPSVTPAPGAPAPDKYEVMIDSLEQQQADLEAQMKELDGLLGTSTAAFMAAVNATATLKAQNNMTIV